MKLDLSDFLNAVRFMTVIPMPSSATASEPDWLSRCVKYFPIVGILIGLASAIVLLLAGMVWGPVMSSLLAVAASVVMTGALHEDGLADTADGLGGGWTREKRLAIMKDSRIGTYGVLALLFGMALRVGALIEMPICTGVAALIAGHAAARLTPMLVMNALSYAGETASMKVGYVQSPTSADEKWFAVAVVVLALLPLACVSFLSVVSGVLLGALLATAIAVWARKLIGGYTGDVLGAAEQLFETAFLLGVAAVAHGR
jgi:adenosylcobinamide-GDP ribazoletransferase